METTYQGWKNHATWMVALHLSNNEDMYDAVKNIVATYPDDYDAAKMLHEYVEDCVFYEIPTPRKNNWGVLLNDMVFSVLEDVDFREIVQSYREQ